MKIKKIETRTSHSLIHAFINIYMAYTIRHASQRSMSALSLIDG